MFYVKSKTQVSLFEKNMDVKTRRLNLLNRFFRGRL